MIYSTQNLVSVAGCDTYLQEINNDLGVLNMKLAEVQSGISSNNAQATSIPAQMALVDAQLATKQAELAAATTESEQRSINIQINSLENKKMRLQNRQDGLAGSGLIDKQLAQAQLEARITVLGEFKTAIETRKAELQASA